MNTDLMFSKKSDHWSTPKDFYTKLEDEFGHMCDPCPLNNNTLLWDGLKHEWKFISNICFINPPYSNILAWIKKAKEELYLGNINKAIFLIPARTDTKWFHEHVYNKPNVEIRFLKGRLKFGDGKNSAPFPSMLVIMRK